MIVVDFLEDSGVGGWCVLVLHGQVGDGARSYSEFASGTSTFLDSGRSGLDECRGRCHLIAVVENPMKTLMYRLGDMGRYMR